MVFRKAVWGIDFHLLWTLYCGSVHPENFQWNSPLYPTFFHGTTTYSTQMESVHALLFFHSQRNFKNFFSSSTNSSSRSISNNMSSAINRSINLYWLLQEHTMFVIINYLLKAWKINGREISSQWPVPLCKANRTLLVNGEHPGRKSTKSDHIFQGIILRFDFKNINLCKSPHNWPLRNVVPSSPREPTTSPLWFAGGFFFFFFFGFHNTELKIAWTVNT